MYFNDTIKEYDIALEKISDILEDSEHLSVKQKEILLYQRARVYTNRNESENVVEINSHGSIASVSKILELLIENGCRLAEPGEFTKRAFLRKRTNL